MKKRHHTGSWFIGCLAIAFCTLAQASDYQVEVLVFSHLTQAGALQEQWPTTPPPDFADVMPLHQALPANQWLLRREQTALNQGPYQTLLHLAWQMPITPANAAKTFHISSDATHSTSVDGTMRVSVGHYFNVAFNLYFAVPQRTLATLTHSSYFSNSSAPLYFHLAESRRMKSNELNYIDYPLFGVLIKIVPIQA